MQIPPDWAVSPNEYHDFLVRIETIKREAKEREIARFEAEERRKAKERGRLARFKREREEAERKRRDKLKREEAARKRLARLETERKKREEDKRRATYMRGGKRYPKQITGSDGAPMVHVPAGRFIMGSNSGDSDEKPQRRVYLDGFCIDKYEVTNARFRSAGMICAPQIFDPP